MKLGTAIARVIDAELAGQAPLSSIAITESADRRWLWVVLKFESNSSPELGELYRAIAPSSAGEFVATFPGGKGVRVSREGVPDAFCLGEDGNGNEEECQWPFDPNAISEQNESVAVARLLSDGRPLDAVAIRRSIVEETWLGSALPPPGHHRRRLTIKVGVQTELVTSCDPLKLEVTCRLGPCTLALVESQGTEEVSFTVFDESGTRHRFKLTATEFLSALGISLERHYGFKLQFAFKLEGYINHRLEGGERQAKALLVDLLAGAPSGDKKNLVDKAMAAIERAKTLSTGRLDQRRAGLHHRRRVFVREPKNPTRMFIGLEPSNESETLLFVGKMQNCLSTYFSDFALLEHTAQLGIDGLLKIRRSADVPLDEAATVELEYSLRNFFSHQHPIRQTSYVICWTLGGLGDGIIRFGQGGVREDGSLAINLSTHATHPWMKLLSFADHMIHVLPLTSFPWLELEG